MLKHQLFGPDSANAKSKAQAQKTQVQAPAKPPATKKSVVPVKSAPPSLSQEEIEHYVSIIAAAAEGFRPGESTTDRIIRERLEAQGLKAGA